MSEQYEVRIHSHSREALKAFHRAVADEIVSMYENWPKRVGFFTGVPIQDPVAGPSGDHGKWIEIRLVGVEEVLSEALDRWAK